VGRLARACRTRPANRPRLGRRHGDLRVRGLLGRVRARADVGPAFHGGGDPRRRARHGGLPRAVVPAAAAAGGRADRGDAVLGLRAGRDGDAPGDVQRGDPAAVPPARRRQRARGRGHGDPAAAVPRGRRARLRLAAVGGTAAHRGRARVGIVRARAARAAARPARPRRGGRPRRRTAADRARDARRARASPHAPQRPCRRARERARGAAGRVPRDRGRDPRQRAARARGLGHAGEPRGDPGVGGSEHGRSFGLAAAPSHRPGSTSCPT